MKKKILCVVLSIMLVFTTVPFASFAAEPLTVSETAAGSENMESNEDASDAEESRQAQTETETGEREESEETSAPETTTEEENSEENTEASGESDDNTQTEETDKGTEMGNEDPEEEEFVGENGDGNFVEKESSCESEETESISTNALSLDDAGNIAGGVIDEYYGHIIWSINAEGKLTVEGTGDFADPDDLNLDRSPWYGDRDAIKSAEIHVKGMTNAKCMFSSCINMKSIDLNDFDTSSVIDMSAMFSGCSNLESLDLSGFNTRNVTDMSAMFNGCFHLENMDLSGFNTANVTNMLSMFGGCHSLINMDLSSFDTGNVMDMRGMFEYCYGLENLDLEGFKTENVTSMSQMFFSCGKLKNVALSNFDTENVTDMNRMFSSCGSLESLDLSSFDTGNVTSMKFMFSSCDSLESLDLSNFDTGNVTSMGFMFSSCGSLENLDLSSFDTGRVEDMSSMFECCYSLKNLDLSSFNTVYVRSMKDMFLNCNSLESLDLSSFDTGNVTSMGFMFSSCGSLESLDLSSFNTGNVTDMYQMFYDCKNLSVLNISSFDMSKVNSSSLLSDCLGLHLLYAPKNVMYNEDLPVTFYMQDGTTTDILPMNLSESVILASNKNYFSDGILMEGTSSGIAWNIDGNGKLTITGTGDWERDTVSTVPWQKYRTQIKSVVITLTGTTDASYMFHGCSNLSTVDLKDFDMSGVANVESMFNGCKSLKALNLGSSDFSKVANAQNILSNCIQLDTIHTPKSMMEGLAIALPGSYRVSTLPAATAPLLGTITDQLTGMTLIKVNVINHSNGKREKVTVRFADKWLEFDWDDESFSQDSFEYKNDLAVAGLVLSAAAEKSKDSINETLDIMGFQKIQSCNYEWENNVGNPAFSFGLKNIKVSGKTKTLVSVTIRGTTSNGDIETDVKQFLGDFKNVADTVALNLEEYLKAYCNAVPSDDLLFFITGHSLGGVTASKLAQELYGIRRSENVYVYSFATPKYALKNTFDKNQVFPNIFEIINQYDTVSAYGWFGSRHAGCLKVFDGSNEKAYLKYFQLLNGEEARLPKAKRGGIGDERHDVNLYMAYLLSKANSLGTDMYINDKYYLISIKCPVNVELYNAEEKLVCKVVNNVCDETVQDENIVYMLYGDQKYFLVPIASELKIKMTGTAEDVMEYDVVKLTSADQEVGSEDVKVFEAVALEDGKTFSSVVKTEKMVSDTTLYVTDSLTGNPVKEVLPDGKGTEIPYIPDDLGDVLIEDIPEDGKIPDGLWIAAIKEYTYTGAAIKPVPHVYDGYIRLEEKKDYTVSYKNNINAAQSADVKAPVIVIKGKGNYSGRETQTFTIAKKNISDTDVIKTFADAYAIPGNKKSPALSFRAKYGNKVLKNKTDYHMSVKDASGNETSSYAVQGAYTLTVRGTGTNYAGEQSFAFEVLDKIPVSNLKISKIAPVTYDGTEKRPKLVVKYGTTTLVEDMDYGLDYQNNMEKGTATITLKGKGAYFGTRSVSFAITGIQLKNAKIKGFINSMAYTASPVCQDNAVLEYQGKTLKPDTDYTISYSNNLHAGKATVIYTGTGSYEGTVKKMYKITAYSLSRDVGNRIRFGTEKITVAYAKGGAKPSVTVYDREKLLEEGKDYTLSYQYHTAVRTDAANKAPAVIVKGKGDYAGIFGGKKTFTITAKDIAEVSVTAPDIVASPKPGKHRSVPVLTDTDGKKLQAGKDYDKNYVYTYKNVTTVKNSGVNIVRSSGETVNAGDIIPANTVLYITVAAKSNSNYSGTTRPAEYRVTTASIKNAKVTVKNPKMNNRNVFVYTGKEIRLDKNCLTVKVGKNTLTPGQYEILDDSYKNNIKKGTASVQIRGTGEYYGGIKTIRFQIGSKGFQWFWRLWDSTAKMY